MTDAQTINELRGTFIQALDLGGTFAFALSGGMAGVRRGLDVFGVLVVSFAAATFGGITRDLLIGAVPPAALKDWRYLAVSVLAGLACYFWSSAVEKLRDPVQVLDAAGLALFAVTGSEKALAFGLNPIMAALLGMLTGIGGGVARDVLLAQVPSVLRSDFYAMAALLGAAVVVGGRLLDLPIVPAVTGGLICFTVRMIAIRRKWSLPVAPRSGPPPSSDRR
ncbi:MAG TPA: trimeric intracellular cation channel family protein [Deinococcales bacterium]|nr:trimeric intracellular cation channel family protein [Deinococcales bacterium]